MDAYDVRSVSCSDTHLAHFVCFIYHQHFSKICDFGAPKSTYNSN